MFPIVRPDAYALRVSKQGFKTAERTNVVVSANDKFSAGVVTLDVGGIEESVSVTGRVSELQATSGERSFTLEGEAIQNIANNGRSPFGFATLVPGILQQGTSGTPPEDAAGFTVNGQRPNSNNVTIDGVANIDTGNNGGNMATTNIDAVAELKILTSSYQAEYGRAVGGQVQIVTKSGSQSFHGSGYWYGRRSGWNANSWTNKRAAAPPPVGSGRLIELPDASRNDFGYTIGGPIFIPGVFNEEKKRLFFFWSQEFQRRKDSVAERLSRVPTVLERAGDFSQSVDNNGNPWPYILDYTTGLPCTPSNTSGCFRYQGILGRIPPDRLYQPGLNALGIYPSAEHHRIERHQLHEPGAHQRAPSRRAAAPRLPGFGPVAFRGPVHAEVGHPGAALRQRPCRQQQPRHRGHDLRVSRVELDGLGHGHPQQLDVARAEPRERPQRDRLLRRQPPADPLGRGAHPDAAALPGRRPEGLHPGHALWRRARRPQRGRLLYGKRPVHEREHDLRRDRQPHEGLGIPLRQVRRLLPEQLQAPEPFRQLQQPDRLHRRRLQPLRHRLRLRERGDRRLPVLQASLEVRAPGMALQELRVVRAGQLEGHVAADPRLRRPLLLLDAAMGHDPRGLELPARQVRRSGRSDALRPRLHWCLSLLGRPIAEA